MTQEEYQTVLTRLEKGKEAIDNAGGFFNAPKHWVIEYQKLAEEALDYEIDNNLIQI